MSDACTRSVYGGAFGERDGHRGEPSERKRVSRELGPVSRDRWHHGHMAGAESSAGCARAWRDRGGEQRGVVVPPSKTSGTLGLYAVPL